MQKPHEKFIELADAFDMADRNVKPDPTSGRAVYTMGAKGLPRTPAQQASVKKAAAQSAVARKNKAVAAKATAKIPTAPGTTSLATGGLGLASRPKGGLLR